MEGEWMKNDVASITCMIGCSEVEMRDQAKIFSHSPKNKEHLCKLLKFNGNMLQKFYTKLIKTHVCLNIFRKCE